MSTATDPTTTVRRVFAPTASPVRLSRADPLSIDRATAPERLVGLTYAPFSGCCWSPATTAVTTPRAVASVRAPPRAVDAAAVSVGLLNLWLLNRRG
jgi:hypothetical protein